MQCMVEPPVELRPDNHLGAVLAGGVEVCAEPQADRRSLHGRIWGPPVGGHRAKTTDCETTAGSPKRGSPSRLRTGEFGGDGLSGVGTLALPLGPLARALRAAPRAEAFTLSVLTDEISQDLGHACEIAAREFGLRYVELRSAHDKNIMSWDANDIVEARRILARFNLRVSELASPIFKVDSPGAPRSPESPSGPQSAAQL